MPEFSEVIFCRSCGSRHTQRFIVTGGRTVEELYDLVVKVLHKENANMATLADIQAAVAAETTVEASVVTLLQQLASDLKAAQASNDPVAMQAVVDKLTANANTMAAAVAANTTAPAPAPAPAPSGADTTGGGASAAPSEPPTVSGAAGSEAAPAPAGAADAGVPPAAA
jgi:hypothetical protein